MMCLHVTETLPTMTVGLRLEKERTVLALGPVQDECGAAWRLTRLQIRLSHSMLLRLRSSTVHSALQSMSYHCLSNMLGEYEEPWDSQAGTTTCELVSILLASHRSALRPVQKPLVEARSDGGQNRDQNKPWLTLGWSSMCHARRARSTQLRRKAAVAQFVVSWPSVQPSGVRRSLTFPQSQYTRDNVLDVDDLAPTTKSLPDTSISLSRHTS
jgi:hypothetical protein